MAASTAISSRIGILVPVSDSITRMRRSFPFHWILVERARFIVFCIFVRAWFGQIQSRGFADMCVLLEQILEEIHAFAQIACR